MLPCSSIHPPGVSLILLIRCRNRDELDAGAEQAKNDNGPSRMIRGGHQQHPLEAAPRELWANVLGFFDRRPGGIAEAFESGGRIAMFGEKSDRYVTFRPALIERPAEEGQRRISSYRQIGPFRHSRAVEITAQHQNDVGVLRRFVAYQEMAKEAHNVFPFEGRYRENHQQARDEYAQRSSDSTPGLDGFRGRDYLMLPCLERLRQANQRSARCIVDAS